MEHCILFRYHSGRVDAIRNEDGSIVVFPDIDGAITEADRHPLLQAVPYQIVCLDEL